MPTKNTFPGNGSTANSSLKLALPMLATALAVGFFSAKTGFSGGLVLVAGVALLFVTIQIFRQPEFALFGAMLSAFFAPGLTRYLEIPWGLSLDYFLLTGWLSIVLQKEKRPDKWHPLRNGIFGLAALWMLFVVAQLLNPEAPGLEAWLFSMRQTGFYQLLLFGLTFMVVQKREQLDRFFILTISLSVFSALWAFRQKYGSLDEAETRWLFELGNSKTHVLFGSLRAFSVFSDAGQFGASQAMVCLVGLILATAPFPLKIRLLCLVSAAITFWGFAISGTRGGVPLLFAGGMVWLFVSRNFRMFSVGAAAIGLAFFVLKFTFLFHDIEQIRRMRSGLNADDASFQVRLKNQETFNAYLLKRPLGAGIGSSGFWGSRFLPDEHPIKDIPTDSYYVRIWVETGIIGLCLHLLMFGFFCGIGAAMVWQIRDRILRAQAGALLAAFAGNVVASYGNQVYSQMPTAVVLGIGLPLVYLAARFDD